MMNSIVSQSVPTVFGIRHLSPAGAWNLVNLLDEKKPRLVLVEGPSDLTDQMSHIVRRETKPPIAIMAYTQKLPIRTILYPMAEYSPEYQAIRWAFEHKKECRFIDLPSGVFLAIAESRQQIDQEGEENSINVYQRLDELSGEDGHETFWERTIEHTCIPEAYLQGAREFGKQLRELTQGRESDWAENLVREAYMKRQIADAIEEGYAPGEIFVITGSYHVQGLLDGSPAMTDEEIKSLPCLEAEKTLMPYSYYRLSSRSGYGAGNRAPAYYELLWQGLSRKKPSHTTYSYLSRIAAYQRANGNMVSSAEVIEAVRLAGALAELHGYPTPSLRDLRDAATTCMGHGNFGEISQAVADTEIGTRIGALPDGVSRTSIQSDFYRLLTDLKLDRFRSVTAQDLQLDLREKLTVKSEKSAFLDLQRSFFLHRLRVLGISFVHKQQTSQDRATWAESWVLRWSPEAEIEIVEAALKGDTVASAASFQMKEDVETGGNIAAIAAVIEDAFCCGMPESVAYATSALQKMAADAANINEIAETAFRLSTVLRYGNIRKLDSTPLLPILDQLFLRACLLLPSSCLCDDAAAAIIVKGIDSLNQVSIDQEQLDQERWLSTLNQIAGRDDLNTKLSGFAAAILLERGCISNEQLSTEVERRLSKGVPAELGANWFSGLSMKNRYALIARMSLWESLDKYLETLDDEEFKRALVFLRRAFADFSPKEKSDIAENLGELWQVNVQQASEMLYAPLNKDEKKLLEELDDFDFGS